MDYNENCVVCLVGNGDLPHDHADHQVVDYHEVDGVPTSEPCPGADECLDCQFVLEQPEECSVCRWVYTHREGFWVPTRGGMRWVCIPCCDMNLPPARLKARTEDP
jgi:hypothetical protein